MSAQNKHKKCLMQNYENILKNCRESLEKYKLLTDQPSARQISAPATLRRETSREGDSCEWHEDSACSRPDFELHEECLRRLQCSKWVETLPPVWDEFLEKDYVECVVHELITGRSESYSTASGKSEEGNRVSDVIEPERGKRDQAVLVRESDLQGDFQAVWKPIGSRSSNSTSETPPHYKGTAPKTPSPPKKPSPAVKISSKGRVLTSVKKPPIPSKSGSKGRVVAPVSKAPLTPNAKKAPFNPTPKSSPTSASNKPPTPRSLRNCPVQSKLSSYSRFVGKPRKFPIDFCAEHPGLVLEDTLETTLFPCRLSKLDSDKSIVAGDEKSTASTEVVPIYTQVSQRSPTDEQDELRSSGGYSREYADRTWQELLLEGANKTKGGRILRFERKPEEVAPCREKPADRDVIYDSANVVRPAERVLPRKLTVQRLPVLCIRGECKVQKIVEISIDGAVAGHPKEDRANVRLFEYSHKAEQMPKSPKGTKNAQNMKIQNDRDESEKAVEVVKDADNQKKIADNEISVEALQKYQLTQKTKNRFIAPFLETDSIEQKIGASQKRSESPRSSQEPIVPSTSGAVNDSSDGVSGSAQTDDEKLQKESFSKTSSTSSSFTNPTTSEGLHQSNQPKESIGTVQSSSGVSHILQDGNIQLKLNGSGEVRNILKEVFSGSEEAEGGGDDEGIPGGEGTASVGIDCSDLTTRIETSVQTEGIGGYYYSVGPGKGLANSSDGEKTLDQIVGRICRDETDAFRKFKLRTAPNPVTPERAEGTPPGRIDFNVTNANDLGIDGRLPGIPLGVSVGGKHPISTPSEQPTDKSPRLVNASGFRADNYTDNLGAIKGDEVEERSHQPDEVSSSSCLGSHGNLLGRQCYCRQHRWRDSEKSEGGANGGRKAREFAYEPVLSPLRDLYDANLRLNSPLMQFNYEDSPERGFRDKGTRDSHKRVLEANPRFSRTLAKIYDAAPNVTARPSSRMDPEVQRAVKKFLESLLEPQSPASNRRGRYTKLNNVPSPPPPRAGPPQSGITSKGWISTSTSPTSTSSSEHGYRPDQRTFSSLWKSTCDSTTLSDTESSDLQRMLYAPLWKDLCKKTKKDDLRGLTRSSTSSTEPGPDKQPQPSEGSQASHHHHQGARDMSEGEVLSLGEVRSLDS